MQLAKIFVQQYHIFFRKEIRDPRLQQQKLPFLIESCSVQLLELAGGKIAMCTHQHKTLVFHQPAVKFDVLRQPPQWLKSIQYRLVSDGFEQRLDIIPLRIANRVVQMECHFLQVRMDLLLEMVGLFRQFFPDRTLQKGLKPVLQLAVIKRKGNIVNPFDLRRVTAFQRPKK